MRVELALFDGESLLERGEIQVTTASTCDHFAFFHATHCLINETAKVVLSNFPPGSGIKTSTLDMPVHQSDDWESIELVGYTLGFRCSLVA
jgi:hypothetical protein